VATKAHGRILVWEGASLWILRAPPGEQYPKTAFHSHHAVQVTLALSGEIEVDSDTEQTSGAAIAVAPDAAHAFKGTGLVAHLFVASDGQAGRQIMRRLFSTQPIVTIPREALADLPTRLRMSFDDPRHSDADLRALGQALIILLAGDVTHAERPDARITKLIPWLTARVDQAVSLREVAAYVRLSPGRTRHLFVQQTGLPFRTYLLWLRLVRAVGLFASGTSLTEAAHGAGFSDSAHLSRTFRRMFGIAAASLRVSG
jgi:AraC family transcriptional regulator